MKHSAGLLAAVVACCVIGASPSFSGPPENSLRPVPRPQSLSGTAPNLGLEQSLRPVVRPAFVTGEVNRAAAGAAVSPVVSVPQVEATQAGLFSGKKKQRRKAGIGKVCRDRKLIGKEIDPVPGKLPGCGIRKGAIELYEVNGVRLSTPSVMNCDTAKALQKWVDKGVERAVRSYGGGLRELKVAAHYACRTRNHKPGAKISEHGKGNAIDISAIVLRNGDTISVLRDWGNGKKGRILRKVGKSACGPFGTVLGPESDRYHRDHFHLDVARHRGGPYCR